MRDDRAYHRTGGLMRRLGGWLGWRRRDDFDALAALDHLNDHLLRDAGLSRPLLRLPQRER